MAIDVISQLSDDRITGLRVLKNEVVGHIQKKEHWVQAGVLRPLVAILDDAKEDYKTRLQALQLLASFASAGTRFLQPIYASGALPAVLNSLQDTRPQIVLGALRVLRDVADACASATPSSAINPTSFANVLFTDVHLEAISTILAQPNTSRDSAAQVSIAARLISALCREEKHQYALVSHGVLDRLATRLVSYAVAEGQVIPRAEIIARSEGLSDFIPAPANPRDGLSDVLGAISAIITDSAFRSCRLLYSPSILAVFPNIDLEWGISSTANEPPPLAGLRPTKQKEYDPMDLLLPYIPSHHSGGYPPTPFPPLSSSTRPASRFNPHLAGWTSVSSDDQDGEEAESPFIPWLISLVRVRDNSESLHAASVLASLYKCGFTYKSREATLGLLVIPKLLYLLNSASESNTGSTEPTSGTLASSSKWDIIEKAPATLARLITDSESLQKAAADSNAVKTLCKLLKGTYDTPPPLTQPQIWSPYGEDEQLGAPLNAPPERRLGEPGQHPLLTHRIRVREGTLKALGALAASTEDYRKAIVDHDVVPYIVQSMIPTPGPPKQPRGSTETKTEETTEQYGNNPSAVIVAACYATRVLSRSVNILRTSLVDNGVAMPIYSLLRHSDLDVQIAATAVICNLLTDVSPMREILTRVSIVPVLCDHARSLSASLRLNALWALKHLVLSASMNLKKTCLEELQSGWLVQLICDDTEDEALFSARSRGDDLDEEMEGDELAGTASLTASINSQLVQAAEARLTALREAELNPVRKARQDDLAIQEQGLDFIRNLIGNASVHPPSSNADSTNDTAEMIDFLFNNLGQDRFFNILATKLRVKVLHPFSGRRSSGASDTRVLYPQAKIIEAVVYILVHVAASIPRHRQLVIAQTELLKLLAGLFNSQEGRVRVALCHLLNNLTWQDDANDTACSQRAVELKKLGFLSKLESLGHDDELDVRERAKSALWQMKHG